MTNKVQFNNAMLYSDKIDDFLQQFFMTGIYLGCFPRDKFPTKQFTCQTYCSCILNLDDSKSDGSHFIAIVKYEDELYIYDSVPNDIHVMLINEAIYSLKKSIAIKKTWFNNTQHQSLYSNACGYFCIWFLLKFDLIKPKIADIGLIINNLRHISTSKSNEQIVLDDIMNCIEQRISKYYQYLKNCICKDPIV